MTAYIGLSYGTYLGETYANMFPDRVPAMLLNGIVDAVRYSKSAEERQTVFSEPSVDVFDQFLSLCDAAGPERCALAGGDQTAAQRLDQLVARLKRKPIQAPGANGTSLSRSKLSYGGLLASQFIPMRAPVTWPTNAANLAAALRGNGSQLQNAASASTSPDGWSGGITSAAIQCADAGARLPASAWLKEFRSLKRSGWLQGPLHYAWEWAPCASWPVKGEDNYRGPWNASTPNPILLINDTHDPNSGYPNAVHMESVLGNAVLLTQEGYGHLGFQNPSACVEKAMADYLTELIVPPEGSVCQSNQQPFDPDFFVR